MKQSIFRLRTARHAGFTLVELLVVIGIIAILAAVTLSSVTSAINAAKRAKVGTLANSIQTAALAYDTEYGVYPVTSGATAGKDFEIVDTDAATWKDFLIGLCGNIDPSTGAAGTSTVSNTHGVAFLNLKTSDISNGAPLNPLPPTAANLYFNIAIDNDYDGMLGTTTSGISMPNFASAVTGTDPPTGGTSSAGVAVWVNCNGNNTTKNPNFWVKTY